MPPWRPVLERFAEKVLIGDECWEWAGARSPLGYGRMNVNNQSRLAHRISWRLFCGPMSDGDCVLHHCDNPGCVKPSHLFLGSKQDNTTDMYRKGRGIDGARHPLAVLTGDDVRTIRRRLRDGDRPIDIAKDYPITRHQISNINTNRSWRGAEYHAN